MKTRTSVLALFADRINGAEMTPDLVTRLAALAFMQAHVVANVLHDTVIPLLPAARRSLAVSIARRAERGAVIENVFLRDLETFTAMLAHQIDAGTNVYWQADDNHVRGGYETVHRDAEAAELAQAAGELAVLGDLILAALSAARAVRETSALIDN